MAELHSAPSQNNNSSHIHVFSGPNHVCSSVGYNVIASVYCLQSPDSLFLSMKKYSALYDLGMVDFQWGIGV